MLSEVWKALLDYLRRTPWWPWLEPFFLVGFLYAGLAAVAFQYVQWRYGVNLGLPLFLQSYLFKQVSVVFWAGVLSYLVLTWRRRPRGEQPAPARRASQLARIAGVALILAAALFLSQRFSPHHEVASIRVMFAPRGGLLEALPGAAAEAGELEAGKQADALLYVLFEINRLQRTWHFETDFTPFTRALSSGADEERCRADDTPPFCLAEAFREHEHQRDPGFPPLLVIAADPLDAGSRRHWFWLHRGAVSVVTTRDWRQYRAPSLFEYLAYTLILQGVLIHLDEHCGGISPRNTEQDGIVYGNVFEYQPRPESMRAAILSGHLGPQDERLLLNCFGPDYLRTTASLLRLDWLRSGPVKNNLRDIYGVDLEGKAAPAPAR